MARQLRIEYTGACYHVLSRGNAGCDIFRSDDDRQDFLMLLKEMSDRFDIEVHAYVLMTNHYHLLIRSRRPNLSKSMQWLGTAYTRRFNLRHSLFGHLFQGRFKSIIVENDAFLLQLSYYIHRNPLRAGMVKRLSDYKWSSYHYYAYKKNRSELIETDLILSVISTKDRNKTYREEVQRYSDEKNQVWEDVKYGLIFGSESFPNYIKNNYLSDKADKELPQLNSLLKEAEPEVLLEKCAKILGCDIKAYKKAARLSGEDRDKRDVLLYELWKTGKYSNSQMGELLGLSFSSVSRRVNHVKSTLNDNPCVKDAINTLTAIIKV